MELTGKIYLIDSLEKVPYKDRSFYKRNLILDCTTYDRYTGEPRQNFPKIEFTGDVCQELDKFSEGDRVKVSFVISGRKYEKEGTTKFFTSIVGFNVTRLGEQKETPVEVPKMVIKPEEEEDDLPF